MLWVLIRIASVGAFYEDLAKIIFELSSNTHLISSADNVYHYHGESPFNFIKE